MIAGLKPYSEMRESGIPGMEAVPSHWRVRKLRNVLRPVTERNQPDLPLLSIVRERGVVLRDTENKDENHNFIPDDLSNYKVVRVGQFAMNKMKAWQGSYGVSPHDGILSPAYFTFALSGVEGDFFHLAIRSRSYVPSFTQASDGVRVGQWDLSQPRMKEIPFLIPPPDEQAIIVRFLDHADRRIRRAIAAKQKLIRLLEEQKRAFIHRAVTRGLDPDVRLKPSGVEWLGDVPEHWRIVRAKNLFSEIDQRSSDGEEILLSLRMRQGLVPHNDVSAIPIPPAALIGFKKVEAGQIVMNRMRASIGMFGVASRAGIVSPDYAIFSSKVGVNADYFVQLFKTAAMGAAFRSESKGLGTGSSGFMRLYTDRFGTIPMPVPSEHEQSQIVEEIQLRTQDIEIALKRVADEIDLLREFRARLVADVATGKLDVREAVATLPELIEPDDNELDADEEIEVDSIEDIAVEDQAA